MNKGKAISINGTCYGAFILQALSFNNLANQNNKSFRHIIAKLAYFCLWYLTRDTDRVEGHFIDFTGKPPVARRKTMAKPNTVKIRLNSTAGTGHFYVTQKNARTMTEKMVVNKYDPVVRKHVPYKEGKIK